MTPPLYADWLASSGLPTAHPEASGEQDDPDGDGMNNRAEMLAGTDPTDPVSVLTLETVPRPEALTDADRTEIGPGLRAVYFRSIPGRSYGAQFAESPEGPWNTTAVVTAGSGQTRLLFEASASATFHRVILAQ
ncbi:MAG: hypothetical protein KF833_17925 [Verrucomicrobiae bacterium]|nr:hypothetical protein [Verrucomicrobiae bacterium]